MYNSVPIRVFFIFWITCISLTSYAQNIEMEVKRETETSKQNLIDVVVSLNNTSDQIFDGFLKIRTPEGFRSISGESIIVQLAPEERRFIPVKILLQKTVKAGMSEIEIELLDAEKRVIQTQVVGQAIAENNNLRLSTESPMVFITNPNDSLSVEVIVSNLGNRRQNATVVFSIPGLTGEKNFFEKTGTVEIQKDTVFVFRFFPPRALLEQPQFTIQVAGMRGAEKELFGNLSINIQNISSNRRYQDVESTRISQTYHRNSVTGSYRKIGDNTNAYQIIGSGDLNLPAGYLSLSGNIYRADNLTDPIVSNTYLAYQLDSHQIKVGNINQPLEMALFGRGIETAISDKTRSKQLQVGFVDQNFNLVERNAFLKYGYGIYAIGTLGVLNASNYTTANYLFREDAMENAQHHLLGIEQAYSFSKDWRMNAKVHGGMSYYQNVDKQQPSFAVETQYNGEISRIKLSGNYFLSTDYFPGNRRGVIQLQQNATKNISKNRTVYTNIFLSNFSPKSYAYAMTIESSHFRFDSGITFPRKKNIGLTIGYQYQSETNNSFGGAGTIESGAVLKMKAYRFIEHLNWISPNQKHSVILGLEEGVVAHSDKDHIQPQIKLNTNYSFRWLNANLIYQYGSFFLSEYASVLRTINHTESFQRLIVSVSADRNFLQNKVFMRAGGAYINDFLTGQTPSAFLNVRYHPTPQYQVFLNSSWYRYDMRYNPFPSLSSSSMLIMEAGVTVNLKGRTPLSGRKGTLTAYVYYDRNTNNIFDEGDEVADDYFITINNTTFKTNEEGKITYRSLPFGTYQVKPVAQQGWFAAGGEYRVDNYQTEITIPLHQNGTILGKIKYDFDSKKVLDFEPKINGITFTVSQNGAFVQRISTNDEGEFVLFLPTGDYQISLNESSLATNTFSDETAYNIKIEAGKITHVPAFIIKVREKKMNIKRFGE